MKKTIPVRRLCQCALLIALQVVLSRFASFQALGLKFGFSFLPMALCGMLYGPWWAAGCYALADTVGALLFPVGAYFPGFSLSCGLMGACYGLFLQGRRRPRLFPDVVAPALINTGVLGLLLNSLWMALLYSSRSFGGWMVFRLPQEAGLLLLHLVLTPLLGRVAGALDKMGGTGYAHHGD